MDSVTCDTSRVVTMANRYDGYPASVDLIGHLLGVIGDGLLGNWKVANTRKKKENVQRKARDSHCNSISSILVMGSAIEKNVHMELFALRGNQMHGKIGDRCVGW